MIHAVHYSMPLIAKGHSSIALPDVVFIDKLFLNVLFIDAPFLDIPFTDWALPGVQSITVELLAQTAEYHA